MPLHQNTHHFQLRTDCKKLLRLVAVANKRLEEDGGLHQQEISTLKDKRKEEIGLLEKEIWDLKATVGFVFCVIS